MKKIRSPAKTVSRGGDWPRRLPRATARCRAPKPCGQRNVFLSFENSWGTTALGALAQSLLVLGVRPEVDGGGFVLLEPPSASLLS